MSNPTYKIPFDKNGDMMRYGGHPVAEWRDPEPFEAKMRVDGNERGWSAVVIWLTDDKGRKYPMSFNAFMDMLTRVHMFAGEIDGRHTFKPIKRGQNYMLEFVR